MWRFCISWCLYFPFSTSSSFLSNAAPRKFLAMMMPFGSSKSEKGIPVTLYVFAASDCQYFKSDTCVQIKPSCLIACNQSSFLRSSETPNTVNPFALYLLKALTTFGFSWRQGPHHFAQKSTSTYLPFIDESFTTTPVVSGSEISGAG